MKILACVFVLLFLLVSACQIGFPSSEIAERPHAKSPDGKAYIYQSKSFLIDGRYHAGIVSYVSVNGQAGGAGLFDFKSDNPDVFVSMYWTSDSTAVIEYPPNIEIIRKEERSFFLGRTIYLKYLEKNAD